MDRNFTAQAAASAAQSAAAAARATEAAPAPTPPPQTTTPTTSPTPPTSTTPAQTSVYGRKEDDQQNEYSQLARWSTLQEQIPDTSDENQAAAEAEKIERMNAQSTGKEQGAATTGKIAALQPGSTGTETAPSQIPGAEVIGRKEDEKDLEELTRWSKLAGIPLNEQDIDSGYLDYAEQPTEELAIQTEDPVRDWIDAPTEEPVIPWQSMEGTKQDITHPEAQRYYLLKKALEHEGIEEDFLEGDIEAEMGYELDQVTENKGTELEEIHSAKQRRYMCAMKDKSADKRPKGLSKAEASEMCSGPMKESKQHLKALVLKELEQMRLKEAQDPEDYAHASDLFNLPMRGRGGPPHELKRLPDDVYMHTPPLSPGHYGSDEMRALVMPRGEGPPSPRRGQRFEVGGDDPFGEDEPIIDPASWARKEQDQRARQRQEEEDRGRVLGSEFLRRASEFGDLQELEQMKLDENPLAAAGAYLVGRGVRSIARDAGTIVGGLGQGSEEGDTSGLKAGGGTAWNPNKSKKWNEKHGKVRVGGEKYKRDRSAPLQQELKQRLKALVLKELEQMRVKGGGDPKSIDTIKTFVKQALLQEIDGGIMDPGMVPFVPHRQPAADTAPLEDEEEPLEVDKKYDVALDAREATERLIVALDNAIYDAPYEHAFKATMSLRDALNSLEHLGAQPKHEDRVVAPLKDEQPTGSSRGTTFMPMTYTGDTIS